MERFFESDVHPSINDMKIICDYGCSFTNGTKIFGSNYSANQYLFVPENVYPILETMFEEFRNTKKEKINYWKQQRELEKKKEIEKLNRLSQFIDPKVPIDV